MWGGQNADPLFARNADRAERWTAECRTLTVERECWKEVWAEIKVRRVWRDATKCKGFGHYCCVADCFWANSSLLAYEHKSKIPCSVRRKGRPLGGSCRNVERRSAERCKLLTMGGMSNDMVLCRMSVCNLSLKWVGTSTMHANPDDDYDFVVVIVLVLNYTCYFYHCVMYYVASFQSLIVAFLVNILSLCYTTIPAAASCCNDTE